MLLIIILIFVYSIIYLGVFVLAHKDPNLIKPLTTMTGGMLGLLAITAIICLIYNYWFISIAIGIVIFGLLQFLIYLIKY